MQQVESGGNFKIIGKSGEKGTLQWMPRTFDAVSKQVTGEVLIFTEINEKYVAALKVQKLLDQGKGITAKDIGMIWNTSLLGKEQPLVKKGINKLGVAYDSLAHGLRVEKAYANNN